MIYRAVEAPSKDLDTFLEWIFFWLVVSTHLKNVSQNGNLPQIGMNKKNI